MWKEGVASMLLGKKYSRIPLAEVEQIIEKRQKFFINCFVVFLLIVLPSILLAIIWNL